MIIIEHNAGDCHFHEYPAMCEHQLQQSDIAGVRSFAPPPRSSALSVMFPPVKRPPGHLPPRSRALSCPLTEVGRIRSGLRPVDQEHGLIPKNVRLV